MEPLVVVSAIVVLVFGYRTVMEVVRDIESDGSWRLVRESLSSGTASAAGACHRLYRGRGAKMAYYGGFVLHAGHGRPRTVLLKRHA